MSGAPPPDEHLIAFYTSVEDEAARLSLPRNRLELLRTQELLRRRLPPPPARLLDVGGGTGAHAAWLAADGHDVTLLDVVPAHVERARALSVTLDRPFRARVGDARQLEVADDDVDACLLLGPLYHLPEPNGGGLDDIRSLERTIASGRPDPGSGFTTAYSHRPDELAGELAAAGLVEIEILGIEGPGWWWFARDAPPERIEALVEPSLRIARLYDGYREMAGASAHLLACGRVASG